MTDAVRTERRDGILEITLDRPKANAINVATSQALAAAFIELRDDPTLRVAIITGGGERFFSAGWDLKAAAEGEAVDADHGPGGFAGLTELWSLDKPVIAAVNGMAMGGGFELALAADLMLLAEHAELALPEAGLGIMADSGGIQRLPRRLPRAIATEMLLTGRRMGAAEAVRWGLANGVYPGGELMDAARALAAQICASAPLAVQAIKEVSRATEALPVREAYALMRSGACPTYTRMLRSEDANEGPQAFAERRAPHWQGR